MNPAPAEILPLKPSDFSAGLTAKALDHEKKRANNSISIRYKFRIVNSQFEI
jgi:hypothetical protein